MHIRFWMEVQTSLCIHRRRNFLRLSLRNVLTDSAFLTFRYLSSKFHLFDSTIIVLSFLVDISLRGPAESIGSLLVVLRLWRLAKISEEVVLGATERMEMLEHHIDDLEAENKHLRAVVAKAQDQSRETRARQSSVN